MRNDILIVDGRHLLWRCSSSYRDLYVEIGGEEIGTGGIYGFLSVLSRVYKKYGGIVLVAWEGKTNFRKKLYAGYKSRREASDDFLELVKDIKEQERRLKFILKYMGVRQYIGKGCEADDVIGRLAYTFDRKDVMIYSGDSDLTQLVTDTTVVLAPGHRGRNEKIYDVKETIMRYGVRPSKIADLKAIAGDSSDSIPGIKGIGDRFAAKLIDVYGDLGGVLKASKKKDKKWPLNDKFRILVKKQQEELILFKDLTTIRKDYKMFLLKPEKSQKKLIKSLKKYKFITLLGAQELKTLLNMGRKR